MRVVDDLGDLHELDAGRNTVKTGHSVPQLLSEEAFRCFLRVPDVKVRCPLTLLIQGKDLEPEAWHALEHPAGACGHLDHALPVEITGVAESDSDADHWNLPRRRAICLARARMSLRLHYPCVYVPQWHACAISGRAEPAPGADRTGRQMLALLGSRWKHLHR